MVTIEPAPLPNPDDQQVKNLLAQTKTIAVVGLSAKVSRDSNMVAAYLQGHGFKIVPVNPKESEILGEPCYPDLESVPYQIDIVDVFRRSEFVPDIAQQARKIGAKGLWLQEGVRHDKAAQEARGQGLLVVQDSCLKVEHQRLMR
jgi:predicted CoA-binding protein